MRVYSACLMRVYSVCLNGNMIYLWNAFSVTALKILGLLFIVSCVFIIKCDVAAIVLCIIGKRHCIPCFDHYM